MRVWVNNVEITEGGGAGQFQVDLLTGVITLGSTLAAQTGTDVEAECEFNVPVRFNVQKLTLRLLIENAGQIPSIPIIEVRGE